MVSLFHHLLLIKNRYFLGKGALNKKINLAVVRPGNLVQYRYGWMKFHGLGLEEVQVGEAS